MPALTVEERARRLVVEAEKLLNNNGDHWIKGSPSTMPRTQNIKMFRRYSKQQFAG